MNHCAVCLKLTQPCKSTILWFKNLYVVWCFSMFMKLKNSAA